jgi:flagellar motility protein MotE (MotC chaperone)
MSERGRLIPAVILGALGLLTLKLIGWTHGAPPIAGMNGPSQIITGGRPEASVDQGFSRLVTRARDPRDPTGLPDPMTTGSVPEKPKDDKTKDAKGKDGKDAKAKAPDPEAEKIAAAEAKKQMDNAPRNAATWLNGAERPLSPAEKALIERLGERREEMDGRLKEIEMREKMLETVERKIESKTDELKQLEDKSNASANDKIKQEVQGLKNLVIMYEAMKPKDAARIFDRLSHDVLVPVVQQMNPRKMSEVLSSMQPEAAEKLTVAIASRALRPGGDQRAAMPATLPGLPAGELQALPPAARP